MRILVVGTGGVGSAFAQIAKRRAFFEHCALSDYDPARPASLVESLDDGRFSAHAVDASRKDAIVALIAETRADAVLNSVDPLFNVPIFEACFEAGVTYLDMAMTLSNARTGEKLGDAQFAAAQRWEEAGLLALVGMGVEPGLSDVFARYAADELFSEIELVGIRDGADLVVDGYDFAPTFSIWTTIEECLNPPVIWERGRGWYTTPPFSEPETFVFPEGIGPVECVNVEHEEVLLVPRWIDCRRVDFKYGLGEEFIAVLRTLHKLGLDSTEPFSEPEVFDFPEGIGPVECVNVEHEEVLLVPRWVECRRVTFKYGLGDEFVEVLRTLHKLGLDRKEPLRVKGVEVAPRDVVAAALPDPATLGERMSGKTCAGTLVTGTGVDGRPRRTYLYHVVDNEWSMREYGSQAVVWQTALNPVVALELLAGGDWSGAGVLGPEAFPPAPFLAKLAEYGAPHGVLELPA